MLLPLTLKALFSMTISTLMLAQGQGSSLVPFTGAWSVAGPSSSAAFESPALGSEIKVVVNGETIELDYSFRRHKTLKLDGREIRQDVRVADGPSYQEVAVARVQGEAIVIVTSRNRGATKRSLCRVSRMACRSTGPKARGDGARLGRGAIDAGGTVGHRR